MLSLILTNRTPTHTPLHHQNARVSDVIVSIGGAAASSSTATPAAGGAATKKGMRSLEVIGGNSPKHRASIVAATSLSLDNTLDSDVETSTAGSSAQHQMHHQQSLDSSALLAVKAAVDAANAIEIVAEPLERILENKLVREKRLEMEKKLESLRKKHDKEKVRVTSLRSGGDLSEGIRKSKFYMNNKLVKRLSSKNMWVNA